jgi:hypothetical protein
MAAQFTPVFTGEKKLGSALLRKVRNGSSRLVASVPHTNLLAIRPISSKEVALWLSPEATLTRMLTLVDGACAEEVCNRRLEWIEDAQLSIQDAHCECIRYTREFGKVICLRVRATDLVQSLKASSLVTGSVRLEGVCFKNSRFHTLWNADELVAVDPFLGVEPAPEGSDSDDGAGPDTADLEEIKSDLLYRATVLETDALEKASQLGSLIERIETWSGTDATELESFREELERRSV